MHNYHASISTFPVGFLFPSCPTPAVPTPTEFPTCTGDGRSWQMSPYLEQTAVYNATNFNWPIAPGPGATGVYAGPAYKPYPANYTAMTTKVSFFLCPSDGQTGQATLPDGVTTFGATNYHFSTGDGQPGSGHVGDAGDPTNGASPADGEFILGPPQSVATITDGSSNTVAGSEQLIGPAVGTTTTTAGATPQPRTPSGPPSTSRRPRCRTTAR